MTDKINPRYVEETCRYAPVEIVDSLVVFTLCSKCSKSFACELDHNGIYNFSSCPYCGKRNDRWILIKEKPGSQLSDTPALRRDRDAEKARADAAEAKLEAVRVAVGAARGGTSFDHSAALAEIDAAVNGKEADNGEEGVTHG